jgi:hypothetical protein
MDASGPPTVAQDPSAIRMSALIRAVTVAAKTMHGGAANRAARQEVVRVGPGETDGADRRGGVDRPYSFRGVFGAGVCRPSMAASAKRSNPIIVQRLRTVKNHRRGLSDAAAAMSHP